MVSNSHLDAVLCESSARLCRAILQVCNDRVVNVLLLLIKELCTDGVERVRAQLVVALHNLKHVKQDAAINAYQKQVRNWPIGNNKSQK